MRDFWVAVGLLWLAGVGLRLTILAVPPVILLIQSDLGLSGTEVGILSGLPVILFGIAALPLWGSPLEVIAILTVALAPAPTEKPSSAAVAFRNWWPDFSNKVIWQVGILFGSVNSVYFSGNAFLPGHLTAAGRPDLISAVLTALNFGQVPASFALLAVAGRLERRALPFIISGALMLSCLAGLVTTASGWTVAFASVLGFLTAVVLTLGFALDRKSVV